YRPRIILFEAVVCVSSFTTLVPGTTVFVVVSTRTAEAVISRLVFGPPGATNLSLKPAIADSALPPTTTTLSSLPVARGGGRAGGASAARGGIKAGMATAERAMEKERARGGRNERRLGM